MNFDILHLVRITPSNKVYIDKSNIPKAERGVFAKVNLKKNEVVESCPVFVLPKKDYPIVKKTALRNYYFIWEKVTAAVCLGYGSIYNHSYEPNATYKKKIKEKAIDFVALKDIKKDEEITVNYNYGNPRDKSPLWIKGIKQSE